MAKEFENSSRERLTYVLVEPLSQSPIIDASETVQRASEKRLVDSARVESIILTSMSLELQKQYKAMDAYSIVRHLRELYNEQARTESFNVSNMLFSSKMEEGTYPTQYALKMHAYIESLNQLGY